ncbi:MAG TPA: DUF2314 domain-containing protein [Gemmataceae bacterium]|nr:DUF2314 domain-containing protein [Gemmataceae bacterium]
MRPLIVLFFVFAVFGCGKESVPDKVIPVAGDDPRMNAAIDKARATVKTFIDALQSPKPGQQGFSVKVVFTDGDNDEHMWLLPVRYDGKKFRGTVNNAPQTVKNIKMGQRVTVEPSKISDWMFVENGKLVGGHTVRVLRDAMTPADRAEFDKTAEFIIE